MSFIKEDFQFESQTPFSLFETNASQVMIHCHDCLEINYITEGSGYYIIEDESYPIHTGDLFIINNSEHHMAVHDKSLIMQVFVFDPHFVWENAGEYDYLKPFFTQNTQFNHQISADQELYPDCTRIFGQIAKEYQAQKPGWHLLIKAQLLLFLGYINRFCLMHPSLETTSQCSHSYDKIRPVIEYIHENFHHDITLDALAKVALMNPSYLSSYFTNTMKLRIFEYIDQVRIGHAKLLLKTTSQSITDISFACGFNNSSYFNRVFKRITGTTPLKYRVESKNSSIFTQ